MSSPTGSRGDDGPQGPQSADMPACQRDRKEAEGPASQQAQWKTRPAGKAGPVSEGLTGPAWLGAWTSSKCKGGSLQLLGFYFVLGPVCFQTQILEMLVVSVKTLSIYIFLIIN